MKIVSIAYRIAWLIARLFLPIAAGFSDRLRRFVEARQQNLSTKWRQWNRPLVWFHVSSLGEFEQARPLIEAIRKEYPRWQIMLSFFSPSGYTACQHYSVVDYIAYLPYDQPKQAKRWYDSYQPQLIFWTRYDYWFHFLEEARTRQIPLVLFSAIFRPTQPFFRWWGAWHRHMLACFSHIFVQEESSKQLLERIGYKAIVAGDTRFDRVCQIADEARSFPLIEAFVRGHTAWVGGSLWEEDVAVLAPFVQRYPNLRLILAPHHISEDMLLHIQQSLQVPCMRYSQANNQNQIPNNIQVLIIDNIGMLAWLYRYGKFAFIGGAFRQGLHNTLEAAVFGKPVLFGNQAYQKFAEAQGLIDAGAARPIANTDELIEAWENWLSHEQHYQQAAEAAYRYVRQHQGASKKIIAHTQYLLRC